MYISLVMNIKFITLGIISLCFPGIINIWGNYYCILFFCAKRVTAQGVNGHYHFNMSYVKFKKIISCKLTSFQCQYLVSELEPSVSLAGSDCTSASSVVVLMNFDYKCLRLVNKRCCGS